MTRSAPVLAFFSCSVFFRICERCELGPKTEHESFFYRSLISCMWLAILGEIKRENASPYALWERARGPGWLVFVILFTHGVGYQQIVWETTARFVRILKGSDRPRISFQQPYDRLCTRLLTNKQNAALNVKVRKAKFFMSSFSSSHMGTETTRMDGKENNSFSMASRVPISDPVCTCTYTYGFSWPVCF